jgi:nicotinamidase-related amidase
LVDQLEELKLPDKALLIIDMLNDFINEGASLEVPAGRKIVPTISKLLNYARDKAWSVLYLCDNHKKTDPEFKIWPPHCCWNERIYSD